MKSSRTVLAWLIYIAIIAGVLWYGDYLIGGIYGIVCACVATALIWMLHVTIRSQPKYFVLRVSILSCLSASAMTFLGMPWLLNQDFAMLAQDRVEERKAIRQLQEIFATDRAYARLKAKVPPGPGKGIGLVIEGRLATRQDFDSARGLVQKLIVAEDRFFVRWDITIADSGEEIYELDQPPWQTKEPDVYWKIEGLAIEKGRDTVETEKGNKYHNHYYAVKVNRNSESREFLYVNKLPADLKLALGQQYEIEGLKEATYDSHFDAYWLSQVKFKAVVDSTKGPQD